MNLDRIRDLLDNASNATRELINVVEELDAIIDELTEEVNADDQNQDETKGDSEPPASGSNP